LDECPGTMTSSQCSSCRLLAVAGNPLSQSIPRRPRRTGLFQPLKYGFLIKSMDCWHGKKLLRGCFHFGIAGREARQVSGGLAWRINEATINARYTGGRVMGRSRVYKRLGAAQLWLVMTGAGSYLVSGPMDHHRLVIFRERGWSGACELMVYFCATLGDAGFRWRDAIT